MRTNYFIIIEKASETEMLSGVLATIPTGGVTWKELGLNNVPKYGNVLERSINGNPVVVIESDITDEQKAAIEALSYAQVCLPGNLQSVLDPIPEE